MTTSIVTGGAGFIGSHLCTYLVDRGEEVICIDSLLTGRESNIPLHVWNSDRFQFVYQDVVASYFPAKRIDYVYHLASPASPRDYLEHPIHTLKTGAFGTFHMLGLTKRFDARFLLASSSEVYGDSLITPQCEEYNGNVDQIGPRGVYDESKRYAEAITMAYHRAHGLNTCIARIFNTFGPKMRLHDGRAVPNFIGQALRGDPITVYGDGTQTRSFCYITDMVDALYKLMHSTYTLPMNLGSTEERAILEFAQLIRALCNSNSEIVFENLPVGDPHQRRPDISKAKEVLEWSPQVSLEDGLARTVDWFRRGEKGVL